MKGFKISGVHQLVGGKVLLFSKDKQSIIVPPEWMASQVPGPHKAAIGGYYEDGQWLTDSQFKQRHDKA